MTFMIRPVAAQSWRQVGPPGGDVQSLTAEPGNTQGLYLGTSDGHIFGSNNGGENWQLLGRVGANHDDVIMSIVVNPRIKSTLYATSWTLSSRGGGVYRSSDSGRSWQLIGLEGHSVRALALAPSNPDTLVAGAIDGVYRSQDAGKSWLRITPENHDDLKNFDSLAIDPLNPDTIYAGTYHLPWKTVDGGRNWAPIHQGMVDDSDVMSITVDQNNPAHVFASACSGIYHSQDGGANWTKFKGIPNDSRRTVHILQDPKRPQTVYAATTEGLWKTADDGVSWHLVTPASWSILSMVIDPVNTDRLILGTERLGLQVSEDGGANYRAANQGFAHRRIVDAAVDSRDPKRVLVVLTSKFEPMLETADAGHTWTPLATGLKSGPPRRVFAAPTGWFAAPGTGGLLFYDRSKASWTPVNQMIEANPVPARRTVTVKKISARTAKGATATAGAGAGSVKTFSPLRARVNDIAFSAESWYAATEEGLLVSKDNGMNWAAPALATAVPARTGSIGNSSPIRTVQISPDGAYIWALTAKQLNVSGDHGKTWISQPLPYESRGPVHLSLSADRNMLLAGDHGVFLSRDSGATWSQASLSELQIAELAAGKDTVVVSASGGALYLTPDAGKSWSHLTSPAADNAVSALGTRADGTELVVASATEGVFATNMNTSAAISIKDQAGAAAPRH